MRRIGFVAAMAALLVAGAFAAAGGTAAPSGSEAQDARRLPARPRLPALPAEVQQAGGGAEHLVRLTDPGAFRDVGLAWSKNRRLLPSAELFRRHVLDVTRS